MINFLQVANECLLIYRLIRTKGRIAQLILTRVFNCIFIFVQYSLIYTT